MSKIELSRGLFAEVSEEDFEDVSRFKWYACKKSKFKTEKFYARRQEYGGGKRRVIYLHHYIFGRGGGLRPAGEIIDHIDGNSLNNRRGNLRLVTHFENIKPLRDLNEERAANKIDSEIVPF